MAPPADVTIETRTFEPVAAGDDTLVLGARIGRYVVERKIGRGSMGAVFAALDPRLERSVAIKVLHASDGAHEAHLLSEARVLAQLSHRNVVPVYDAGREGDRTYVVMELVDGQTLTAWLVGKPWRAIVAAFVEAGTGLAAAHACGVVHGDVKGSNILVGRDGIVRVVDFGLASSRAEPTSERSGRPAGTPAYLAPERYDGGPADPRADQYAFAIALFRALYGHDPFTVAADHEDRALTRKRRGLGDPPPSRVPRRVFAVIARALAPDPAARWPDIAATLDALVAAARGRRRVWIAVAAIAAAGLVAAGLVRARPTVTDPCAGLDVRLARATSPVVRAMMASRFTASGLAYAADALPLVARGIDDYVVGFTRERARACSGEIGARAAIDARSCLDHRLDQLDATVQRLKIAEPADIAAAPGALADLVSGLAECRSTIARATMTPADDADQRVLAAAAAAQRSGANARALELARQALASARAGHRTASEARALFRIGAIEAESRGPEAAVDLEAAFHLAQQVGDDQLATDAGLGIAQILAFDARRAVDVARWDKLVESLLIRIGEQGTSGRWARLLSNRRIAAHFAGDDQGALALARSELEVRERLYGVGSYDTLAALDAVGTLLSLTGDHAQAEAVLGRARDGIANLLGAHHPRLATVLFNLSSVQLRRGDLAGAQDSLERAIAIRQRATSADDPTLWIILNSLAIVEYERGHLTAAIAAAERGLALVQRKVDKGHADVAIALDVLGAVLVSHGELERAAPMLERALAIREATFGATHASLGAPLMHLGTLAMQRHQYPRARERFERAVRVLADQRSAEAAEALTNLGWCELALRAPGAAARLREAVARSEAALGPDHPALVRPWRLYGEALLPRDRRAGLELLERAVARGARQGAPRVDMARAQLVLASALAAAPGGRSRDAARIAELAGAAVRGLEAAEQPAGDLADARGVRDAITK